MELAGETVFLYFYVSEDVLGCTSASHLRDAQGVIALYDVTDAVSFEYAEQWLQDMDRSGCKDVVKVLVGYKNELEARKVVDNTTARELADQLGIASFEVSDKSGAGVMEMMGHMATQLLHNLRHPGVPVASGDDHAVEAVPNESSAPMECDHIFTLLLVGDRGKDNLVKWFVGGAYTRIRDHQPNLEFNTKKLEMHGKRVQLGLWIPNVALEVGLKKADGVIVVYDAGNKEPFQYVQKWFSIIRQRASPNVKMLLVANKMDVKEKDVVDYMAAKLALQTFAAEQGVQFIETNAQNGNNVDEAFITMALELMRSSGHLATPASLASNDTSTNKNASEEPCGSASTHERLGTSTSPKSPQLPAARTLHGSTGLPQYDYIFNLYLCGEVAGKTSLMIKFKGGSFSPWVHPTIGIDMHMRTLTLGGKTIKLMIWDSSVQSILRSRKLPPLRGIAAFIVVYDITSERTFNEITSFLKAINETPSNDALLFLVGNKTDLATQRVVDYATGKAFADLLGMTYIETSAKDGTNVEELFTSLAAELKRRSDRGDPTPLVKSVGCSVQ
ncbi:uncharacterized protein LOC144132590 isoform X3 [Amblyomma americanum]